MSKTLEKNAASSKKASEAGAASEASEANAFLPALARVAEARREADNMTTLRLAFQDEAARRAFSFKPGQFVELSVFGVGEAPISISSNPFEKKFFEVTVKNFGNVSRAAQSLAAGAVVGVRGPFGRHYPVELAARAVAAGKSVFLVAGGVGAAPLHSVLSFLLSQKTAGSAGAARSAGGARGARGGGVKFFYAANKPSEFCFLEEFRGIRGRGDAGVFLVASEADAQAAEWDGETGSVIDVLSRNLDASTAGAADAGAAGESLAVVCGPPGMMDAVVKTLLSKGFDERNVFVSLERVMKCGFGKCGRCAVRGKFVCVEGPVFAFGEAKKLLIQE